MSSEGRKLPGSLPPLGWFLGLPWLQSIGVIGSLALAANAASLLNRWEAAVEILPAHALPLGRILLLALAGFFAFLIYRKLMPHLQMLSDGKTGSQGLRPGVEKALAAADDGRVQDAYTLLEAEVRQHTGDPQLAARFWDAALACGRAEEAARHMMRSVTALLNARRDTEAAALWVDVTRVIPNPSMDARALVKLAPLLAEEEPELAAAALRQAVAEDSQGFSLGLALRVVELTQDSDPDVAARAARRAMKFEALDDEKRDRLVFLLKDLEAEKNRREAESKRAKAEAMTGVDPTNMCGDDSQWDKRSDSIDIDLEETAIATPPVVEKATPRDGLSMDLADELDPMDMDLPAPFDASARLAEAPALDASGSSLLLDVEDESTDLFEPGLDLSEANYDSESGSTLALGPLTPLGSQAVDSSSSSTSAVAMDKDPITGKSLLVGRPSLKAVSSAFGGPDPEPVPEPSSALDSGPEPPIAEVSAPALEPEVQLSLDSEPELTLDTEPESSTTEVSEPVRETEHEPTGSVSAVPAAPLENNYRFQEIQVMEVTPVELGAEALSIRLKNGRTARLAFAEVQAVAVAAVEGLSSKPVAVLDLATNWNDAGADRLRVVRLRSDAYDPRKFAADTPSVSEALRILVRDFLGKSGAALLPQGMEAREINFQKFADLKEYQREVLKVDC